jgi:hypothetical protein
MPRGGFIAMVLGVVLFGGGLGWWLGRPQPLQPTLTAHLERADPNHPDPASLPTGADNAPGWEKRAALRAAVATALDTLERSPCDAAARKAFFEADVNMEDLHVSDSGASPDENGPAFWRTDDDRALGKRILALVSQKYITMEEIGHLLMLRRMGAATMAQNSDHMPMQADKCGFTPASLD